MTQEVHSNAKSPREVFALAQQLLLKRDMDAYADLYAEDAVEESIFPLQGGTSRTSGREEIRARITAAHRMFPLEIHGFDSVVVHETLDPEVIIAEYNMNGRVIATDRPFKFSDLLVLRIRDGKIISGRAYTNPLVIAETLGLLPQLLSQLNSNH